MRRSAPQTAGFVPLLGLLILAGGTAWACKKGEAPDPRAAISTGANERTAPKTADFSGWIPFSSEEAGFFVRTPVIFSQNTEVTPTDAGEIRLLRFTAQPDFRRLHLIVVNRMPEALLLGRNPVELLQGAREGILAQFSGTVVSERQMVLDGNAGLELKLTGTSQGLSVSVVSRVLLAGTSLYQLYVIAEKGYEDEAAVRYFLDSFQLK